jgi:hypothetical protein
MNRQMISRAAVSVGHKVLSRRGVVSRLPPVRSARCHTMASAAAPSSSLPPQGVRQFVVNSHRGQQQTMMRWFTTTMPEEELKQGLREFQDLFEEARYALEDATDSAGTTYFEEDSAVATEAVSAAVTRFTTLIDAIPDLDQKNGILRGNGLKVEQLKGELEMALKGGHDHH